MRVRQTRSIYTFQYHKITWLLPPRPLPCQNSAPSQSPLIILFSRNNTSFPNPAPPPLASIILFPRNPEDTREQIQKLKDVFVTVTCNPDWLEFKRILSSFPPEKACNDIPNITRRVFYTELCHLLFVGNY